MRVKLFAFSAQKIWRPTHPFVETVGVLVGGIDAHVGGGVCLRTCVARRARLGGNGNCGNVVRHRRGGVVVGSFPAAIGAVAVATSAAPVAAVVTTLHRTRPLGIERHRYLLKVVAAVVVAHGPKEDIFGGVLDRGQVVRVPGLPHANGMRFGGIDGGGYHGAMGAEEGRGDG